MLRSSLGNYSDAYTLIKETIAVTNTNTQGQASNGANKKAMHKNCAPFASCISRIYNTQVDDAQYIDVVMPINNLIEYSYNYSKTSGVFWQYCRDEPAADSNNSLANLTADKTDTNSFKIKQKITGQTGNNDTKNVEIIVPLKYLRKFWRTLEMSLINCEINLDLNWSKICVIVVNYANHFQ